MNNLVWIILPWVLLAGLYIYIFSRKRESERMRVNLKRTDWITFFACIFGAVALSSVWDTSNVPILKEPWIAIAPVLAIVILVAIAFVRKARTGRPVIQIMGDERIEMIYAKSSRNALFVTYLALFIRLSIMETDMLETNWLLIVLASGLFALIASTFFYYYTKS